MSIYIKRAGFSIDNMSTMEYLNWVESAMMDSSDHRTREDLRDYLYEIPELVAARTLESWGTDAAAEALTAAMMEASAREDQAAQ